jgi:glycosyltransferase involved in cell wall biosynthesis
MNKPLISYIVLCYNQERFIREAVSSALAQTYSPLEIVISDDCSKDRTFEIARQITAAYKGPHTVRLNRNPTNLGLSGNSNRAVALCQGELIVGAAGDDISVPERTSIIVRAWNDSGRKAISIYSRFLTIDESGRPVGGEAPASLREEQIRFIHKRGAISGFLRRRTPHVTGCAYATSRKLISLFGPLPETVTYEDTATCFRTILAKGVFTLIDAPLVKYRRHGQNITFALHKKRPATPAEFEDFQVKLRCELERFLPVYDCFAADAQRAIQHGLISRVEYPAVKKRILYERRRFELKLELLVQPWFRRLGIFYQLFSNTIRPREMLQHLPYLLPKSLYRAGVISLNRTLSWRGAKKLAAQNHPGSGCLCNRRQSLTTK